MEVILQKDCPMCKGSGRVVMLKCQAIPTDGAKVIKCRADVTCPTCLKEENQIEEG